MAKSTAKLNNYSGGIDLATSERDIESNEFVDGTNISVYRPGLLMVGHKAILNPEIPGLSFGTLGAGFHVNSWESFRRQKIIQFKHDKPFANCFAANYGAPLLGVTLQLGNYKYGGTNDAAITSAYNLPSTRARGSTSYGLDGKYSEAGTWETPSVTWVIGNELPKPARNVYCTDSHMSEGITEWCRWRYECGYDLKAKGDEVYDNFRWGLSYGGTANRGGLSNFCFPAAGGQTERGNGNGQATGPFTSWPDDAFVDCAVCANPSRTNPHISVTETDGSTDSDWEVQPKMVLRFSDMMSGSLHDRQAAPMATSSTNNFHATRLRPGTWYTMKIRYTNVTPYSSNTFGLAYSQTFEWKKDHQTGGFQEPFNGPSIGRDITGERVYDWLDLDESTENGNKNHRIKFEIKPNADYQTATIRFRVKDANYDDSDDWTRNLHSTYFCLCFSTRQSTNPRSGHSTLSTSDIIPYDGRVTPTGSSGDYEDLEHPDLRFYIHHMKIEVDRYQDRNTYSDPENIRDYEGNGDIYTMLAGEGETVGDNKSINVWLHSKASGFWTEQNKFRNTHRLGLYPYNMNDDNSNMSQFMPPIRYHYDGGFNEWQDGTSSIKLDSYYVNGALRLKNDSTWKDKGVWLGYIDNEMYNGARNYWYVYNKTYNGNWKRPTGAWWETGWYLLPKHFDKPEGGRFTIVPYQLGVQDDLEKWKYPIDKKEHQEEDIGKAYTWNGFGSSYDKRTHLGAWFPQRDDFVSYDWGPSYIESNGHDINVTMQFCAKGLRRVNSSGDNVGWNNVETEIDSYDEDMSDELKAPTSFGISYLYDGKEGEDLEFGHMQETSITTLRMPPFRIPQGADHTKWRLNDSEFTWQAQELEKVQPFRLHWSHGNRYHVANPRLSGFKVYLRQKEEGVWASWFPMCEVNFIEGRYKWFGNGNEESHAILNMTTSIQNFSGHAGNSPISSENTPSGADTAFVTKKNNLFINKDWNDEAFTHSNKGLEWRRERTKADKNYSTCPHKIADGSPIDEANSVLGEYWCTGVHALRALNDNRSYKERYHFEPETLKHQIRYECSTVAKNRVFIGNITDSESSHPSRIIVSPKYKYDTFSSSEYIEYVGDKYDDEIIELHSFKNHLAVFKRYSIHIVSLDTISELKTKSQFVLENNGIRRRYQSCETLQGLCWFNKYGLYWYDGEKVHNLLKKDITIAEGVTVNKKRIDLETWGNLFDNDFAFITYDATLEQIMVGNKTDSSSNKTEFIYDFTTKSFSKGKNSFSKDYMTPPITGLETGKSLFFRSGILDQITELDSDENALGQSTCMVWDDLLTAKTSRKLKLITKDIDFKEPSRRKKFYKLYVTFKSTQYDLTSSTDNPKPFEYCDNSKIKIFYALNGTRDWQEFDYTKSINYSDLGSSTATEGEHGLVVWEDTNQAILEESLSVTMQTSDNWVYFVGDTRKTIFPGMAIKVDDEIIVLDRKSDGYSQGYNSSSNRTKYYLKKRNINVENPHDTNPSLSTHTSGATIYVFSNLWTQATLIPKTTDIQRNSFYSIQFKIESVSLDDYDSNMQDRRVPSRFAINDISIVYRDKYLK
tara:strand:- start:2651 stop:7363 length:4713 start_codon:yes stop_codon:yes gene_type:complete